MKIGIDISQLAHPGTGVASYTENLVENLLKIDKKNEYILFFSSLRQPTPRDLKSKIYNLKSYKFPPLLLEFLWNRVHLVPIETFTGRLDVFHTSDWLEPPAKCPKVTTIHDLAIFKYPETFVPRGGHNIVANLKRKLKWVKKESKLIITVSENTKRDIVKILGMPPKKIRVIYEACDEIYNKQQTTNNIEKVKKKYGIKGDYILAVGTLEPRKNLKRVIEAHNILISQYLNISLVIAGKFGWGEDIENVKCSAIGGSNVKFLGYAPKEDLAGLYSGAQVFVYPSLYEGFGLPILEAMTCGCSVVTSNVSSMPEVAGEAAVLVDPENIEDIVQGIKEAMDKRKELIKKGFERAKQFSWEKTARETLKVYEEAYVNRG